ncbi:MAG: MFS transporter [Patescibacteria group bacterium]
MTEKTKLLKNKQLFANKNFLKLWSSQLASQLVIFTITFVFINKIFELTGSTIAVSLIWIFSVLPALLIAPFSSFFVDLWQKKKILTLSNLVQALIIISYLLIQSHSYHLIYLLVFLYSLVNQFYLPAESASIPWLVDKKSYPAANSLFLLTGQFSFVASFGLGSLFIKLAGENSVIVFGALVLVLSSLATAMLPKEPKNQNLIVEQKSLFLDNLRAGWDFILKKKRLVALALVLMVLFQTLAITISLILPVFSVRILSMKFADVAPILVACLGLGIVTGAYLFGKQAKSYRKKSWISGGLLVLGLCLGLVGLIGKLNIVNKLLLVAPILFVGSLAAAFIIIPAQTFVQETVPQQLRGRIFGILNALIGLGTITPTLLVAGLVDLIGVIKFISSMGIGLVLLSFYLFKKSDQIILATSHRN